MEVFRRACARRCLLQRVSPAGRTASHLASPHGTFWRRRSWGYYSACAPAFDFGFSWFTFVALRRAHTTVHFVGANPLFFLITCHSQSGCTAKNSVLKSPALTAQTVGSLRYLSASNSDHLSGLLYSACAVMCWAIQMRCADDSPFQIIA